MALLYAKDLCKTFQTGTVSLSVLHNITLEINEGECVALIGKSGSGKSTLMNILGCLDTPTHGDYFIDNQKVSSLHLDELAYIRNKMMGFVFQQFHLISRLTVLENVALPCLYAHKSETVSQKNARTVLEHVGLADKLHAFPYQLSGGQQQRVAIARALVNHPRILLADEPTGNLDTKTEQMIMEIFFSLHKETHLTLIIVTHNPELVQKIPKVIQLVDGRIDRIDEK